MATKKYKERWMVEAEVLNGGLQNIGHCIPIVFISNYSKTFLKEMEDKAMTMFLKPFIRKLKTSFCHGIDVQYNFPSTAISPSIVPPNESNTSRYESCLCTGQVIILSSAK